MRPLIVIADGFDLSHYQTLTQIDQFDLKGPKVTPAELEKLLPQISGLVVRSQTQVNSRLLSLATKLQYVIRAGEGVDNIELPVCAQKGIKVSNTPGANNNSAAEHALALMLTLLRKTAWANSSMQKGEWNKNLFMGNELSKKTVGIVGFGRIGRLVAQRLLGFENKILFFDPFVEKAESFPNAQKVQTLEELFSQSDIITIHLPLTEETRNVVDGKLLGLMRPHGLLINAARGKIVCEKALFEVLSQNKIRGAAFDVFEQEPLPENSPLRNLPNMILTPHLGASTEEAQDRVGEMVIQQLKEFFLNKNLLNEVKA